jgi:hypothetical protein
VIDIGLGHLPELPGKCGQTLPYRRAAFAKSVSNASELFRSETPVRQISWPAGVHIDAAEVVLASFDDDTGGHHFAVKLCGFQPLPRDLPPRYQRPQA